MVHTFKEGDPITFARPTTAQGLKPQSQEHIGELPVVPGIQAKVMQDEGKDFVAVELMIAGSEGRVWHVPRGCVIAGRED